MTQITNSKTQSEETEHIYLELGQIEKLRDAAHEHSPQYLSLRNELIVILMSDLGLRVDELVNLKEQYIHLEQEEITIPGEVQKDYPNENSPKTATLEIDPLNQFGTIRLLRTYINSSWYSENKSDSDYLFPSRQSDKMTTESVRNVVKRLAVKSEIQPKSTTRGRVDASELHPHSFRHSVANYMLRDQNNRLIDVRNRLRHRSIITTESIYEHFKRR